MSWFFFSLKFLFSLSLFSIFLMYSLEGKIKIFKLQKFSYFFSLGI